MKGLFIPEITAEMFRNGCLESIETLMAEGEIYDIEYSKWIPVSERLPECEQKVLVLALHRNSNYVITTGMYEDGSLPECDSMWNWEEVNYEKWDDENDCGIIPEGWYEYHEYNPDGVLNYEIGDKVIAWMPLPEPYKESE